MDATARRARLQRTTDGCLPVSVAVCAVLAWAASAAAQPDARRFDVGLAPTLVTTELAVRIAYLP